MMTELHIPYDIWSTVKFEKDANGSLKCTKKSNFKLPSIKTVSCELESLWYLGPMIWKLVPNQLKEMNSLELFKKKKLMFKD